MTLDGQVGSVPAWYRLVKAAKWMHVPPWELLGRPDFWTEWALMAEAVDDEAVRILRNR